MWRGWYHEGAATASAAPTAAVLVRRNADAAPMAEALDRARGPRRGRRPRRAARGARGGRCGGDAAAGRRSDRGRRGDAGAHRAALAAGRPRHRRAVAARRSNSTTGTPVRRHGDRPDRRAGRRRRRRGVPGRCDLRSGPAGCVFRGGAFQDRGAGPRADRAARPSERTRCPIWSPRCAGCSGVDTEVRAARPVSSGWSGTEHLDAFADVVADFAAPPGRDGAGLLAYLDAAEQVENGLAPAEVSVANDRVQILTVHAAKGLEWQIVAVPHLSGRVFPSTASTRTWLTDAGDLPPLLRGDRATVSEHGVPVLDTADVNDRKRCPTGSPTTSAASISGASTRSAGCCMWRSPAPRTPCCCPVITGVPPNPNPAARRLPLRAQGRHRASAAAGTPCGVVEHWGRRPADGEPNPLRDRVVEAMWPIDPGGAPPRKHGPGRRAGGAGDVGQARRRTSTMCDEAGPPTSTRCWPNAKPRRAGPPRRCPRSCRSARWSNSAAIPTLSRSGCVGGCRGGLTPMRCWARRFTTGCSGSSRRSSCSTSTTCPVPSTPTGRRGELEELQAAFAVSAWAARTPLEVEVPFDMVIAGRVVRGRIDAIFADADGGVTVVDWKTGEPPTRQKQQHATVQLAMYRLAWARLQGCPVRRCARRSTTCAPGRPSHPNHSPVPMTSSRCSRRKPLKRFRAPNVVATHKQRSHSGRSSPRD